MIRGPLASGKGARWRGFGPRVALALLLASAILLCHGILGASHVLAHGEIQGQAHGGTAVAGVSAVDERPHEPEDAASGDAAHGTHHGAAIGAPPDTGGASVTHETAPVGAAEYFAVLLALAVAVLLAAFFGANRAPLQDPARPALVPLRAAGSRPLPRGPSPPLLQVFRL